MRTLTRFIVIGLCSAWATTNSLAQNPFFVRATMHVENCYLNQLGELQQEIYWGGTGSPSFSSSDWVVQPSDCGMALMTGGHPPNTRIILTCTTQCGGAVLTLTDTVQFTATPDTIEVQFNFDCTNGNTMDCLGVTGGGAVPGTPCVTPGGAYGTWDPVCTCIPNPPPCEACFTFNSPGPFMVDFSNCSVPPSGENEAQWELPDGSIYTPPQPWMFNSPSYTFDSPGVYPFCFTILDWGPLEGCSFCDTLYVDSNGNVSTTPGPLDCEGVPGGPAVVGSPCDDGDPATFYDMYMPNCTCAGVADGECYTWVDWGPVTQSGTPVPFEVEYSASTAGALPITYSWYFGDVTIGLPFVLEGTSSVPNWSRTFSAGESLAVQVVALDANGCESIWTNVEAIMPCDGILGSLSIPGQPCTVPGTPLAGVWSNDCACVPTAPMNDECSGAINVELSTPCAEITGDLSLATETLSAINCAGFIAEQANDLWYSFTATTTSSTIEVTGDGDLDLVLEAFAGDCITLESLDCSDDNLGGASETLTISTTPGNTYLYRVYSFTTSPNAHTFTICATEGEPVDCEGTPGGLAQPGTVCVTPNGTAGLWSSDCQCVPSTPGCLACFTFEQASSGGTLTPFTADLINCTSLGVSPFTFQWTLPSGTSTQTNETVVLAGPGAHDICLTIFDSNGCISTTCDSIFVDDNGILSTDPTPLPCAASFWTVQAYDNSSGNPAPVPNTLWVWNLTSGGSGVYQFLWSFGDGTSSTEAFPTHTYAGSGPYTLCLTISDSEGCTSTHCDTLSVDDDGIYNGLIGSGGNRSALTVNVVNPLAMSIEESSFSTISLWPNPAREQLNIALDSRLDGAVNMEVIDLHGRVVMTQQERSVAGNNRFVLSTEGIPAGLYALRISNGSNTITQRFVRD